MAATTAPEKTEIAAAADDAGAAPRRLMSPMGYIVVGVVMLVTAGIVYTVTKSFNSVDVKPPIQELYEEIDLGQVMRELAPDSVNLIRDQFMVKIVLILNPKYKHVNEMKSLVERRKNLLKDIVTNEIIYPKSDADLRKASILDILKTEIKQRINAELGASAEGHEMIQRVIFPESRLPVRR